MRSIHEDNRKSTSPKLAMGENKIAKKLQGGSQSIGRAPRVLVEILETQIEAASHEATSTFDKKAENKAEWYAHSRNNREH